LRRTAEVPEERIQPSDEPIIQAILFQHGYDRVMFDHVESFSKIKFEDNDLFFRLMALMEKFKAPSEAILNSPAFDETILVLMNDLEDHLLKAISKKFSEKLKAGVEKRDRSIVSKIFRVENLWYKSNKRVIDALEVHIAIVESMTECMKIILNNMPAPFKKEAIETIRTRGSISRKRFDDIINLLRREGKRK
jgi:hypothetical protein